MALHETAVFAAQKPTRANPSRLSPQLSSSGSVEFAVIKYTLKGTEVAGEFVNLAVLPAGAIPLPQLSGISCGADPASGVFTVDIGTAADTQGWADGVNIAAGGHVTAISAGAVTWLEPTPLVADVGFENSGSAVVSAKLDTLAGPTAGVNLYFLLAYKLAR